MYIVRNCFVAKPGMASKLAAHMKSVAEFAQLPKARILTDATGDFNRVVMEFEIASLTDWEARMQEYMTKPEMKEKMAGYAEMWVTGHREVMKVM